MKKFQIITWLMTFIFLMLFGIMHQLGFMQVLLIKNDMMYWPIFFPVFLVVFIVGVTTIIIKMQEKKNFVFYIATLIALVYWFFLLEFFDRFYMTLSTSAEWLIIVIGLMINFIPLVILVLPHSKVMVKNYKENKKIKGKHENSNIQ